jgi:hypothetical protein
MNLALIDREVKILVEVDGHRKLAKAFLGKPIALTVQIPDFSQIQLGIAGANARR